MKLNEFDLGFVIDTTGSMGSFINEARKHMLEMIASVTKNKDIDIQIGIVEYRDHEPEDPVLTVKYPLSGNIKQVEKDIKTISLGSGGDAAEAVLDGIQEAVDKLKWRPHARRIIVLVGDASPHGYDTSISDHWPKGCPCGKTISSVTSALEESRITLYSIGLTSSVKGSFEQISILSGGSYFSSSHGSGAIKEIQSILSEEFKDISFDKEVFSLWEEGYSKEKMSEKLNVSMGSILSSLGRMRAREILN